MNNLQFIALLTPAVGSLVLVVLAWIHSNSRSTRLEHTVDQQGAEMRSHFTNVQADMRALRVEMSALRDVVYREMVSLHERLASVEAKQ